MNSISITKVYICLYSLVQSLRNCDMWYLLPTVHTVQYQIIFMFYYYKMVSYWFFCIIITTYLEVKTFSFILSLISYNAHTVYIV